jgi:hypothetical protein
MGATGRGKEPLQMHVQRTAGRAAAVLAVPLMLAGMLAGLGPVAASAVTCQSWTGGSSH